MANDPLSTEKLVADVACKNCRRSKAAHVATSRGLECPESMYYSPCDHKAYNGTVSFGADGKSTFSGYCMTCGASLKW